VAAAHPAVFTLLQHEFRRAGRGRHRWLFSMWPIIR
jgi:hypothetical protein